MFVSVNGHHALIMVMAESLHSISLLHFNISINVGKFMVILIMLLSWPFVCTLQRLGIRVISLDTDLCLANINILLGLTPHYRTRHLLTGQKRIEDVLVERPDGMLIFHVSSGIQELLYLSDDQRCKLFSQLAALEYRFDFLLVNTAAGISSDAMYFNITANDTIVIVTSEPTFIADAYTRFNNNRQKMVSKILKVFSTWSQTQLKGEEAFRGLDLATDRFLDVGLDYLGCVVFDTSFTQAVRYQKPLIELYRSSTTARCFQRLAKRLTNIPNGMLTQNDVPGFWQQLLTGSYNQPAAPRRPPAKAVL